MFPSRRPQFSHWMLVWNEGAEDARLQWRCWRCSPEIKMFKTVACKWRCMPKRFHCRRASSESTLHLHCNVGVCNENGEDASIVGAEDARLQWNCWRSSPAMTMLKMLACNNDSLIWSPVNKRWRCLLAMKMPKMLYWMKMLAYNDDSEDAPLQWRWEDARLQWRCRRWSPAMKML